MGTLEIRAPILVRSTRPPLRFGLRVTRGQQTELVVLDEAHPSGALFASAGSTVLRFARLGFEHIVLGPDHLLFLLTVVVAGVGWRYWLAVVTSFTIAHSITLTLAALGLVHVRPAVVEPLIAASIVAMALDNLYRGAGASRGRPLIVFACGLLHGLGFASGLQELGLSAGYRSPSIVGFNLGIELGQGVFLCGVLGAVALGRKFTPLRVTTPVAPLASAVALLLAAVMFVQRL